MLQPPSWEDDTDEFLKSMLTGSDLSGLGVSGSEAVCPSDTSSDSGCPEEQVGKMMMTMMATMMMVMMMTMMMMMMVTPAALRSR